MHLEKDERCYLPNLHLSSLMNSLFFQDFRLEVKGAKQIINIGFSSQAKEKNLLKFSGVLVYKSKATNNANEPKNYHLY